ncbi:MAG TPA: hypothetical protein VKC65_06885 [Gaiellaceae bacterium]|nr:hypothetical protein [Gaiellaceae bacterium]
MGIRNFLRRFRPRSVEAGEGQRSGDERVDASAAAMGRGPKIEQQGEVPGGVPPGYIKSYDEGRPKH